MIAGKKWYKVGPNNVGFSYQPNLEIVAKVYAETTRGLHCKDYGDCLGDPIWQKESATDKAIRDLKDSQAKASAEFDAKIKALEETVK